MHIIIDEQTCLLPRTSCAAQSVLRPGHRAVGRAWRSCNVVFGADGLPFFSCLLACASVISTARFFPRAMSLSSRVAPGDCGAPRQLEAQHSHNGIAGAPTALH